MSNVWQHFLQQRRALPFNLTAILQAQLSRSRDHGSADQRSEHSELNGCDRHACYQLDSTSRCSNACCQHSACCSSVVVYKSPTALLAVHHLTCGISSLLHSVNLIVFTLLLVHLILHISPHHLHCHHLHSHHLSLPRPFTPDLKLVCFTIWSAFTDLGPGPD